MLKKKQNNSYLYHANYVDIDNWKSYGWWNRVELQSAHSDAETICRIILI